MKNHGQEILRDYRSNKFWGKAKARLAKVYFAVTLGGSVLCFVAAGFISMNALVGFVL